MIPLDKVTALLLASGLSRRFGTANKLIEPLDGKPLVAHAAGLARSLPLGARLAVVPPQDRAVRTLIEAFGFETVANPQPEDGRESSLRLGLSHALEAGAQAILVLLADMPHVDAAHIRGLAEAASLDRAAVSAKGDQAMPPLIIPAGIARIALATAELPIRAALSDAVRLAAPEGMLRDYDTQADFESARLRAIP
jgi:molybdenum cofactor cytidylyltransferase